METAQTWPGARPFRVQIVNAFSHPASTAEQAVVTVTAAQFGGVGLILAEIDCTSLTKNSNVCRILGSFGGVTFTPMPGRSLTGNLGQIFTFEFRSTIDFRVGLTSGASEGAPRSIPYRITVL